MIWLVKRNTRSLLKDEERKMHLLLMMVFSNVCTNFGHIDLFSVQMG